MMNIESKLWKVVAFNDAYATITQKASGVARVVLRPTLPRVAAIADMHERRFDRIMRAAFHGEPA